jgi:FAD/FMN-containing dehydrogenase
MSATLSALPAGRARERVRYAIGGVLPRLALRPDDAGEAAATVRACASEELALVPWGGGVALSHEASPPPRYDVALDLGAIKRIVTYEPDDFTVTAECGIPIAELCAALAEHGQELPLEAGAPAAATLGGVLATNTSGPRRLRLGAPRDRILGARFLTGDGVAAHTGGRVVKNVAGHAVHRLLVGSRGGLGVLLEASLKLLPMPPARAALVHGADAARIGHAATWAPFPRREPAVLTVIGHELTRQAHAFASGAPFTVITGFEDDPAWVDDCERFTSGLLGGPRQAMRDAAAAALWGALADAAEFPGPRLTFTSAHNTPDAIAPLANRPVGGRLLFHAPCGRLHLWPAPEEAESLVGELAARGFRLLESRALPVDPPLPPASVIGLRARLSAALDPSGTLAYGARWRGGR